MPFRDVTMAVKTSPAEIVNCKRRDVLEKVKAVLDALENPGYELPIPKARLMGEKCECALPKYQCEPPSDVRDFKARPAKYW